MLLIATLYFSLLQPPWEETFDQYHRCSPASQVHIFHRNGCGPTPQSCGNRPTDKSSQIYDLSIDTTFFWTSLLNISSISRGSKLSRFSYLLNDVVIMNCAIEAKEYCLGVKKYEIPLDGWPGSNPNVTRVIKEYKSPSCSFDLLINYINLRWKETIFLERYIYNQTIKNKIIKPEDLIKEFFYQLTFLSEKDFDLEKKNCIDFLSRKHLKIYFYNPL